MKKILILFAHPALERSRVNRELIWGVKDIQGVTFHDLYQLYPDFYIDVQREQELLLMNDIIVWHHPLYWYSVPPLLKQWMDLVLEHDWAYGSKGNALKGKMLFNAITAGGGEQAYCENGYNRYTLPEFFRPFEQTACLCGMQYLPPFVIFGTHRMGIADCDKARQDYHKLLETLGKGEYDPASLHQLTYLNEILSSKTSSFQNL